MGLADRDYMKGERWQLTQRAKQSEWRPIYPDARDRPRTMRYLAIALVAAVPAAGAGYAIGADVSPFAKSAPLVWGGEEFTSKPAFQDWLRERGLSYRRWAERHPAAATQHEAAR